MLLLILFLSGLAIHVQAPPPRFEEIDGRTRVERPGRRRQAHHALSREYSATFLGIHDVRNLGASALPRG